MTSTFRLNKYLAASGVASRRASDTLILEGRVTVNGRVADDFGIRVDPEHDRVTVDGRQVRIEEKRVCLMLNKPSGCLTTVSDPFGRPTVMDLLHDFPCRIYPVGRLDYETEGLLLLTNDGALSHALLHPKHAVEKEYDALVQGDPAPEAIRRIERGVRLDGRMTAPARVRVRTHTPAHTPAETHLSITLHEGRKRQVRRMCRAVGHPVIRLRRIRLGPLTLNGLASGAWRYLTPDETKALQRTAGLKATA